ncbi:MAG: hypothetical protein EAX81_03720 [Candidatus Thorarchaeota archaeon]|nr:hypothetical protein [Candidatus Thorarchaeota archaeon]
MEEKMITRNWEEHLLHLCSIVSSHFSRKSIESDATALSVIHVATMSEKRFTKNHIWFSR